MNQIDIIITVFFTCAVWDLFKLYINKLDTYLQILKGQPRQEFAYLCKFCTEILTESDNGLIDGYKVCEDCFLNMDNTSEHQVIKDFLMGVK